MGFVGDLVGLGGNAGMSFRADKANVLQPVSLGETHQGYNDAQRALHQQNEFVRALQGQGGIQNQSNVFGQQQGLANLLGAQALGYGPNPALQQLSNTTGQNVANQAALMAGQRGAGANAGLMARQIGQQGAGIQQNAVGQAALMRAQQQLAAQQALQQQQGMMGNLAGQQVSQLGQATMGANQAAQSEQANLLNALAQYNNANVAMQSNVNNANAGIANTTAQGQQGLFGGVLGGVGSAIGMAHGGQVPKYAFGDLAPASPNLGNFASQLPAPMPGPQSNAGQFLFSSASAIPEKKSEFEQMGSPNNPGAGALNSGMKDLVGGAIKTLGPVIAAGAAAKGGIIDSGSLAANGKMVPGKAEVKGDSLKNDKVPAILSPKEIVIPRSITLSKDAPEKAKAFVAAVLARNGMRK